MSNKIIKNYKPQTKIEKKMQSNTTDGLNEYYTKKTELLHNINKLMILLVNNIDLGNNNESNNLVNCINKINVQYNRLFFENLEKKDKGEKKLIIREKKCSFQRLENVENEILTIVKKSLIKKDNKLSNLFT